MEEVRLSLFIDKTAQPENPSKAIKKLQQRREFSKVAG